MTFEVTLRRFIGGLVKPNPTPFDAKDELIKSLKEDLGCVHMYLDDIEVPRTDDKGEPYSIVGRIKALELKQAKALSELESTYLEIGTKIVNLSNNNNRLIEYLDKHKAPKYGDGYELSVQGRISKLLESYQKQIDKLTDKPEESKEPVEYVVGTLNRRWGINGFTVAEVGHFVYEKQGKYVIYLSNDKVPKHEVGFFKETLKPAIDFFVLQ